MQIVIPSYPTRPLPYAPPPLRFLHPGHPIPLSHNRTPLLALLDWLLAAVPAAFAILDGELGAGGVDLGCEYVCGGAVGV